MLRACHSCQHRLVSTREPLLRNAPHIEELAKGQPLIANRVYQLEGSAVILKRTAQAAGALDSDSLRGYGTQDC